MRRFWSFVIKEFFHIFRDYRTLIVLFGIPVADILIFGYVISNEIKDVRIAILDQSRDEETQKIADKILSSDFFILNRTLHSESEIEAVFREGNVKEVIVFEPDFAKKLTREGSAGIQLIADASDANTANLVVNYTNGIILDYMRSRQADLKVPMRIVPEVRMYYNDSLKGTFMFVPGIIVLILTLICAMMTSISITREKEMGTMEVLLISPLKPIQIVVGKVTPYVALSFIDALLIIFLGWMIFQVPVMGSFVLLLGLTMLYIMVALSLGIFISTVTSTQQLAMFISAIGLMLPTVLLSGFIFPIENMPKVLQWFTYIMPPRWFISAIRDVMLKGTGFMYIWQEIAILSGMTLVFMILSVKRFKVRL
jgi:ABC-2 type transport system permease protein